MIYDQGNSDSHNGRLCQSGTGRIGRSALFWATEDTSVNINWEIPFYSPSTSKLGVLLRNGFPSRVNMTHYFSTFFLLFRGDSFLWQLLHVSTMIKLWHVVCCVGKTPVLLLVWRHFWNLKGEGNIFSFGIGVKLMPEKKKLEEFIFQAIDINVTHGWRSPVMEQLPGLQ